MAHQSAHSEPPIDDDAGKPARKRRCIGVKASAEEAAEGREAVRLVVLQELPADRRECRSMPRPCYLFRCRLNLYLDVNERTGSITLNFPDMEPHQLEDTCAMDVADRGPQTLRQMAKHLNVTFERSRQTEADALYQFYSISGWNLGEPKLPKGTK